MVRDLRLRAATDVTGFGLGGHCWRWPGLEGGRGTRPGPGALLARGRGIRVHGHDPGRQLRQPQFLQETRGDGPRRRPILLDLVFDAQTSGGMVLAVPGDHVAQARSMLLAGGDMAEVIGRAVPEEAGLARLRIIQAGS